MGSGTTPAQAPAATQVISAHVRKARVRAEGHWSAEMRPWRRRTRLLIASWAERKHWAWSADLNRYNCRSRRWMGWREFSALSFSPSCLLCSTERISSRFAAPQLAILSVIPSRGGRNCFFSGLRISLDFSNAGNFG